MLAEKRLPGHFGCARSFGAQHVPDGGRRTVLPIDYGKLKNAGNLLPDDEVIPTAVGHIYSARSHLHPKVNHHSARSYKDVFDPNGNKLGISTSSTITRWSARRSRRRQGQRYRAGKNCCWNGRKSRHADYPTNEAFAQGLSRRNLASA